MLWRDAGDESGVGQGFWDAFKVRAPSTRARSGSIVPRPAGAQPRLHAADRVPPSAVLPPPSQIRSFRVYHALYMIFYTQGGDSIDIDRGTVYFVNHTTGVRTYTCASNVECAAFLAAGVDIEELSDQADLALLQFRIDLTMAMVEVPEDLPDTRDLPSNSTVENSTLAARRSRSRRLNFDGHVNADGSGRACKVTSSGRHKMIVGGEGTQSSPYVYRNIKVDLWPHAAPAYTPNLHSVYRPFWSNFPLTNDFAALYPNQACSLPNPDHQHSAGSECSFGWTNDRRRRRQLRNVDGSEFSIHEYMHSRKLSIAEGRRHLDGVPSFNSMTEMIGAHEEGPQTLPVPRVAAFRMLCTTLVRLPRTLSSSVRALCATVTRVLPHTVPRSLPADRRRIRPRDRMPSRQGAVL